MANAQRGQLRIDGDIGARVPVDTNIAQIGSAGAEQAAGQVAQTLSGISARVSEMADKAAAVEGLEAGKIAGLDPEFRTMRNGTIRGEAFDKAGLAVAETRFRQQIEHDFDAAFEAHSGNPAGLQGALSAKETAILSHAPQELKPELQLLMKGKRIAYSREQTRRAAAEAEAEAKAAFETQLGDTLKGVHQRAYALGLDGEADKVVASDIATLAKTLERRGPDGKRIATPSAAAKMIAEVKETVSTARLTGAFSRLPSLAAKEAFIKQFDEDFRSSRGLAAEYDLPSFERVKGALEADYRAAKAEHGAAVRAVAGDVETVARLAEKGFAPSPVELSGLKSRVIAAGDPETAAAFKQAETTLAWQAAARSRTPEEIDAWAADERARMDQAGATPEAVQRVEMAERLADSARTELKSDPLGWSAKVGRIKLVDLDPGNLKATLGARMAQADEEAAFYGQEPQYLRPAERQRLSTVMAQGGEQAVALASAIADAAGPRAVQVMGEISKEAPAVAMLGGHVAVAGVTPLAQDAASGLALWRLDGYKKLAPEAGKAREAAGAVLGRALSELPRAESAALTLANAAYEARAARQGLTDFDEDTWKKALSEALGARDIGGEQYGGVVFQSDNWGPDTQPVIVPGNVKASGFRELVDAVRIEDFAFEDRPRRAGNTPAATADLRRATLKSAGDAKYFLAMGDPDGETPDWLLDAGGDRFVLDLKALEPVLKKRRRDLYLGGR